MPYRIPPSALSREPIAKNVTPFVLAQEAQKGSLIKREVKRFDFHRIAVGTS